MYRDIFGKNTRHMKNVEFYFGQNYALTSRSGKGGQNLDVRLTFRRVFGLCE